MYEQHMFRSIVLSNSLYLSKYYFHLPTSLQRSLVYESQVVQACYMKIKLWFQEALCHVDATLKVVVTNVKVAMIDHIGFHRKSSIVGNMSSYT